jgi:uncharacterized membrane protein YphA (DoxX/SURF4 family)
MSFSQFSGTAIMPLLARVVLAAAFLPVGFHKIFHTREFQGESAAILTQLGVGAAAPVTAGLDAPAVHLASYRQDDTVAGDEQEPSDAGKPAVAAEPEGATAEPPSEASPTVESPAEATPTEEPPSEKPLVAPPPTDSDIEPTPVSAATPVVARSMHGVTVMLHNAGWKNEWKPQYMAWMASLTEFLGGALILLGLFSRIWGLGLAIAMGFAFYLVSIPALFDPGWFALGSGLGRGNVFDGYKTFNTMFCQLSLLLLGLSIFLVGPGPVSLDRLLFRRSRPDAGADYDVTG